MVTMLPSMLALAVRATSGCQSPSLLAGIWSHHPSTAEKRDQDDDERAPDRPQEGERAACHQHQPSRQQPGQPALRRAVEPERGRAPCNQRNESQSEQNAANASSGFEYHQGSDSDARLVMLKRIATLAGLALLFSGQPGGAADPAAGAPGLSGRAPAHRPGAGRRRREGRRAYRRAQGARGDAHSGGLHRRHLDGRHRRRGLFHRDARRRSSRRSSAT